MKWGNTVNLKMRFHCLSKVITISLLAFSIPVLGQDYEEVITDYSEKFLTYSQIFVKFASQNIDIETDYGAALAVSRIADEFHLHTSYIGDFLLMLKIFEKDGAGKELASRLVKLRIGNVMNKISDANQRVKDISSKLENKSIIAAANDFNKDLTTLQQLLEKIHNSY